MVLSIVRWNITVIKVREINWMWHIMRMCRLKYTRYLSESLRKYGEWWVGVQLGNFFFRVCGIYSLESRINPLTPNDLYMSRTAPLTSKRCILYIYSTSVGTEYFKHDLYSPFFSLQNAVCFIMQTSLVPVLFTFYIEGVLKLKKK